MMDQRTSDNQTGDISGALLDAEKRMLELLALGAPLRQVLEILCATAESHLGAAALTSVLLLDEEKRLRHGAAPTLPAAYNAAIDGLAIGPSVGSCGTAAHRNELVVVSDIATDERWKAFASLAEQHGLRACWSMPIESAQKRVLGTFAIYYRQPRAPSEADLRLMERLALIARVAIEHDLADKEREALIAEARRAQAAAEAERATLRDYVMKAPAVLCLLRGPDHVFEIANPVYLKVTGNRDIIGRPLREALPELVGQGIVELLDKVYTSREPHYGNELPVDLADESGRLRKTYFNFVYQPTLDAQGKVTGIAVYANEVTEQVEAREKIAAALQLERRMSEEMAAQNRETEAMLRELIAAKADAERRLAALESGETR